MASPLVIAGGGLAAIRTAQALRDRGHGGPVVVLSDEDEAPYDRPPLSKAYLLGEADDDDIRLLGADALAALELDLKLGQGASGLDPSARRVFAGGEEIGYETLVVATGASPIELPVFGGYDGVTYLRDAGDARRLRTALAARPKVGIVGGGFIGLEVAAVATELGCEVTVVEMASEPLAPVLGPELGGWIRAWHEDHGVAFRCGSAVVEVDGDGRIERLMLADGTEVDADVAVVGVGVRPNIGWLADSGLELHRGLVCDAAGRSSDPHVFGVGDATCRHRDGECSTAGHWTAAGEGARAVAAAILGEEPAGLADDGYFWSDQFGKRLQFAGAMPAEPRLRVVAGGREEGSFLVACGSGEGSESAVLALDMPRDFIRASLALRRGQPVGGGA